MAARGSLCRSARARSSPASITGMPEMGSVSRLPVSTRARKRRAPTRQSSVLRKGRSRPGTSAQADKRPITQKPARAAAVPVSPRFSCKSRRPPPKASSASPQRVPVSAGRRRRFSGQQRADRAAGKSSRAKTESSPGTPAKAKVAQSAPRADAGSSLFQAGGWPQSRPVTKSSSPSKTKLRRKTTSPYMR